MTKSATIDPELCIGSLECNRIAELAFQLDEQTGVSVPLPGLGGTDAELLVEAASFCPTQAIRILDDDGSVLYGET